MALNSVPFLLFLAITTAIYYIVPKKFQWVILLLASYGFYISGGYESIFYILGTTLITYIAGRLMQNKRNDLQKQIADLGENATKEDKQQLKKTATKKIHRIQVITVLINLGVLAYVKYLNFFIGNINNIFGLFQWDINIPLINMLVPLGLSYYTFNSIGYLIDVGRGKIKAEENIGKFALFTSFFPSIVQGPLFRFGDVGKQLQESHNFDYTNVKFGAQLILWGFFKKLLIADRLSVIPAAIFAPDFIGYSGSHVFFGVLAYSFQIYCDFSGGVDIARGAAQMLGINLPLNFERPFFATSLADFWRRWHMSLGAWMREFVFYPIMLSKPVTAVSKHFRKRYSAYAGKLVPSVAAPLVVFFLIGIWHGLTWQYIVNGLYNAIVIASSVALAPVYAKLAEKLHVNTENFSFKLFQIARTFIVLCISRTIVKAPSISAAGHMLYKMFTDVDFAFITGVSGELFQYGIDEKEMFMVFIFLLVVLVVGILQENGIKLRETIAKQNIFFRWAIYLLALAAILIFGTYGPSYDATTFIYGNF